jgi:ATP-dependent DNA helicase RecQ
MMLIDILRGSKNAKIREAGMDTLSTYGIMADNTSERVRLIIDYLLENDYLALSGNEYPTVRRSELSRRVISASDPVKIEMMLPKDAAKTQKAAREKFDTEQNTNIDQALFVRLKTLRTNLAFEAHVPSYVVFADASLRDMCIKLPKTPERFLEVSGVGKAKLEKYGDIFINAIREHQDAKASEK